jgi:hypothetical protein
VRVYQFRHIRVPARAEHSARARRLRTHSLEDLPRILTEGTVSTVALHALCIGMSRSESFASLVRR